MSIDCCQLTLTVSVGSYVVVLAKVSRTELTPPDRRRPSLVGACQKQATLPVMHSPSTLCGWLGNRVVSVLDSGAVGPGFNRSHNAVG